MGVATVGRRGPAKTPSKVLTARGSWRGVKRVKSQPKPDDKAPRCPAWLSAKARVAWKTLIPKLTEMGVIGTCDRNALARYCDFFVRWRAAADLGDMDVALKISTHLLRIEQQFGLTPSARASLAVPDKKPKSAQGKGRFFKDAQSA